MGEEAAIRAPAAKEFSVYKDYCHIWWMAMQEKHKDVQDVAPQEQDIFVVREYWRRVLEELGGVPLVVVMGEQSGERTWSQNEGRDSKILLGQVMCEREANVERLKWNLKVNGPKLHPTFSLPNSQHSCFP